MKINEIFLSIDGEGKRTGIPTVFIRKFGCNLRCSYCDTMYAVTGKDYTDMSVLEIVDKVRDIGKGCKSITITGGEPLVEYLNPDSDSAKEVKYLLSTLSLLGYDVNIESNGAVPVDAILNDTELTNCWLTLDYKCPSSGEESKMILENIPKLRYKDVLKFVVGSKEDLCKSKYIIDNYAKYCQVYISPVFGNILPSEIVDFVLDNKMWNVKTQIQLHKIIWEPDMRGV